MAETKRCPKCGALKTRSDFGNNKSRADGLKHSCKECCYAARRDWAARNPDRIRQYRRDDMERHPETIREGKRRYKRRNAEKINEYRREYHAQHPEKNNRRKSEWRQSNREKHRAQKRGWEVRNPDKHREIKRRSFVRSKDGPSYAKAVISQLTGVPIEQVPFAVAEAKAIQLRVTRIIRALKKGQTR